MLPDISQIGQFNYSWDFDQENYQEYLEENGLKDNNETLLNYIKDEVVFDIEFLDNENFHSFDYENMYIDEISNKYGDKLANIILDDCLKYGKGEIETISLYDEEINLDNPSELNNAAKKLLQHGDYYKDCRGFILSDGTVVYTPNEHNQCTIINGVKNTFHFIHLGNIRLLQNSIDIGRKPTMEQANVLKKVIDSYSDSELYVDIMDKATEVSVKYTRPRWKYVLGEINRYFDEGIKPQGKTFYESKKTNKKKRILLENNLHNLMLIENVLNYRILTPEPLRQRWHHERKALKDYLVTYGQTMISRENGKEYKVIQDTFVSNLLGINYCVCLQWNSLTNTPGEIIYIRALDKFLHTN